MFAKWKQGWLKEHEEILRYQFADQIQRVQNEFEDKMRRRTVEFEEKQTLKEKELKEAFSRTEALIRGVNHKNADLEEDYRRIEKLREETEKERHNLKEQLKLIEAKAHPSAVWCEAFSQGFSKAWDMMMPFMQDGLQKVRKQIEADAIENIMRKQ